MQRIDRREKETLEDDVVATENGYSRQRKEDLVLNQYEQLIAAEVVAPEDIAVGFQGPLDSCLIYHTSG